MNKQLRAQLWWRCQGYCEKCETHIDQNNFAAHHRQLRSQGGKDDIQNLVALCHNCHNLGTKSIHLNPKHSYLTGWMVHGWQNPASVLICTDAGLIVSLNPEGTKTIYQEKPTWLENQQ